MQQRKTILYIIDSLGRGGAEVLLVGILSKMAREYNVVVVTLTQLNEMQDQLPPGIGLYSLNSHSKWQYPAGIVKLRRIIKQTRPDLIHAHLLNSSIVIRLAAPAKIPIIISLHSILSKTAFNESWIYRTIEKSIFNKRHFLIAVSKRVLEDYQQHIGTPQSSAVLPNYVEDVFNQADLHKSNIGQWKLVCVGNVKRVKNYDYLLEAFMQQNRTNVSLDIYGKIEPETGNELREKISRNQLPIRLKGASANVASLLSNYDAFVMPSKHEGFGIAAIEAMAAGLPLLLSDIPVLREVTFNNALFFSLEDPKDFWVQFGRLQNQHVAASLISNGRMIVAQHYSKEHYIHQLLEIYKAQISKA